MKLRYGFAALLALTLLLPAASEAQPIFWKNVVPYHSQIPPGDPNVPANWPFSEPGNAVIPNGFCTLACLDMLWNDHTGNGAPHNNPPLPQQEFAAVANTSDVAGGGTWAGTMLTDARRAIHFSSTTGSWPNNPPNYIPNNNATGYTFASPTWPLPPVYGMVAIDGNWTANGWNMQLFKQVISMGYAIMINCDAQGINNNRPIADPEDSDSERTGYMQVEETAVGHSILIVGYNDNPGVGTFIIHDPTLGRYVIQTQNIVWNTWWLSKDFLLVAPWGTTVTVPGPFSFAPFGFTVNGRATYTDPLPTQGTGLSVDCQGSLVFRGDSVVVALAQGQAATLDFDQVTDGGDTQQLSWQCTVADWGENLACVDTWGQVSGSSHSCAGGYTDDIGSVAVDTVKVVRPTLIDISICNVPRFHWWWGQHIHSVLPDYAPGVPNDFSAEVENRGLLPATDVMVHFFFGDPSLAQCFPSPLLAPFATAFIPFLAPGETVMTDPVPFIPPAGNSFGQDYYDFVVLAETPGDPQHDIWVELDNNIACKSVHHVEAEIFTGTTLEFLLVNPLPEPVMAVTRLEADLPPAWYAQLVPAGMDSILLAPEEIMPRMLAVDVSSGGEGTVDLVADLYDLEGRFLRRCGGLQFAVTTGTTASPELEDTDGLFLASPRPNPSRGSVVFGYRLGTDARADLTLYDVRGRQVRRLAGAAAPASGTLAWDGRDEAGAPVAAGLYFARLRSAGEEQVRKLVLLR